MKLTVNRKAFVKHLETAGRAVEKKATIPILQHVLLDAHAHVNTLTITGTDLELGIVTTMDTPVSEGGAVTVPIAQLLKACKGLETETLGIEWTGEKLALIAGRARAEFPTMSRDSFPELPTMPDARASIDATVFAEAIARTQYAISPEESRFTLNGSLLEWNGHFRMVATDGHRLSIVDRPETASPNDFRAIVPKCFTAEVARLCNSGTLEYSQDDNHVYATLGDTLVIARRLTGNFPPYERVLPRDFSSTGICDSEELAGLIKRALPFADSRSKCVQLTFADGQLGINAETCDSGAYSDSIPMRYSGASFEVGYNAAYIADFLRTIDGGDVAFRLNGPKHGGELAPAAADGYRYVLMPMRI
jgi:DNA polymerase-3 subunit beta